MLRSHRWLPPPRAPRGSVLVVALLFATAIAIALGSYLQLANSTLRAANRAHLNEVATNLAETGLERGMLAIAHSIEDPTYDWSDWTVSGANASQRFEGFTYPANTTGFVRVLIQNYQDINHRTIVARATIEAPRQAPVEKWLRVQCERSSPLVGGVMGGRVQLSGGSNFDSYSSRLGDYGATLADGSTNLKASIQIGAQSLAPTGSSSGSITVAGRVAVGSEDAFELDSSVTIGPAGATGIDPAALRYDFTMDYDDAEPPDYTGTVLPNITSSLQLPRPGDPYVMVGGRKTYHYTVTEGIHLSGTGEQLQILPLEAQLETAPPINVVVNSGGGVTVSGPEAGIEIARSASLALYSAGDIYIGGAGVANEGRPANLQIWGTKPATEPLAQQIDVRGRDGRLSGVIYAPRAQVRVRPGSETGGDIFGAVVGAEVRIDPARFHYDEALRQFYPRFAFRLTQWEELARADERAPLAGALNF